MDLTTKSDLQTLLLSIHPLDTIILKIPKGFGTFFSNWKSNKGLKLDVEAENLDGNIVKYKSFDSYIDLQAVVFLTKNYYLKFFNDGDKIIQLPMMFSLDLYLPNNDFFKHYSFSLHEQVYDDSNNFSALLSPFIISKTLILDWAEILMYLVFIIFFMASLLTIYCPCYNCFQCCNDNFGHLYNNSNNKKE